MTELKCLYNKWLFKKYGLKRGDLFENIPTLYRLRPLFSPSLYCKYEMEVLCSGLSQQNDR